MDDAWIEAWIARGRVKEMQARGWRTLGPIRDGAVWMRGPDPDAAAPDMAGDMAGPVQLAAALPAAAIAATRRLRNAHAAALSLRAPHGRRVA